MFSPVRVFFSAMFLFGALFCEIGLWQSIEILFWFEFIIPHSFFFLFLVGYKDRMDTFFSFIPGMSSRVGNHIDFPKYETDELVEIAKVMIRDLEYELDDKAAKTFEEYIAKRKTMPFFSNARTVRNAMDRARMNSAIRIFNEGISGKEVSVKDLKTITGSDFQIILDEIIAAGDDAIVA